MKWSIMSSDIFKQDFKYYKSRCPPPKYSKVLDFSNPIGLQGGIKEIHIDENCIPDDLTFKYGLRPLKEWTGFTLDRRKGLIFIRNPFLNIGQRLWITKCLNDYTKKPNKLNLDVHGDLKASEEWWDACNKDIHISDKVLQKKLRWSTLGYHHDWDSKVYTEVNKNNFPNDLAEMCKIVAKSVGFGDYIPQASIVNYYHMDSTLAPHTDHSEVNLEAPLISISFGQSALFLIGGETKDIKPDALFLHSGDILIMSKESRLCYHAVPRIISAQGNPWDNIDCNENISYEKKYNFFLEFYDEAFWKPFGNYLTSSRINLNVRQVLFKNQSTLDR